VEKKKLSFPFFLFSPSTPTPTPAAFTSQKKKNRMQGLCHGLPQAQGRPPLGGQGGFGS
jgi:hypothetical protein